MHAPSGLCLDLGLNGSYACGGTLNDGPEVGFEEITGGSGGSPRTSFLDNFLFADNLGVIQRDRVRTVRAAVR